MNAQDALRTALDNRTALANIPDADIADWETHDQALIAADESVAFAAEALLAQLAGPSLSTDERDAAADVIANAASKESTREEDIAAGIQHFVNGLNLIFAQHGDDPVVLDSRGRRYQRLYTDKGNGGKSAFAFVEKGTGLLYKSAGWKAPAAGAREDISTPEKAQAVLDKYTVGQLRFGGFLYR